MAEFALSQLKLIASSIELGDFLLHKHFAAKQVAAEVQTERIDHKLLAEDHAQIGRLAHRLAQAGGEVAPVHHRVEHLPGVLRIGRAGVLFADRATQRRGKARRCRCNKVAIHAHARFWCIHGQHRVDVARLQ